ncbi:MAG TPA: TolC family protein [Acidobacteriota bacterium]|nr:TolC family protein [Acidobacteriota bacterium]
MPRIFPPLTLVVSLLLVLSGFTILAQNATTPEVLDLQKAISMALEHNRQVLSAGLDVGKTSDELSAAKTHYYPAFNVSILGSQLLSTVDFTFQKGIFGTYPGIGPVPGTDTSIVTPKQPIAYIVGSVQQSLTDLYKIKLNTDLLKSSIDEKKQAEREQRHETVNNVKKVYYGVLQNQSSLQYSEQQVKLYEELQRITDNYVAEQTALKTDSLQVQTRLAKARYDVLAAQDDLATQREQLNILMGRDIRTEFGVNPVPEEAEWEQNLEAAQNIAIEHRPELQQAAAKLKEAEYDRRIKKSEYIPQVAVSFNYVSPQGIEVVPTTIMGIGLLFTWDIYDWGRKSSELAEKSKTIEQAKLSLTETESRILLDVNTQYRKLKESRQLIQVAKLGQDTAEENLRVVTDKYKQQSALLKEVLQAQTTLEENRNQYQDALLSFWAARADFEQSLGEDQ